MRRIAATNKYRDYYFMAQFEVGQQELIDVHNWTYAIDVFAMLVGNKQPDRDLASRVHAVNQFLVEHIFFSTQRLANYEKFLSTKEFQSAKVLRALSERIHVDRVVERVLRASVRARLAALFRFGLAHGTSCRPRTNPLAPQGSLRSTRRRKTSTR